MPLILTHREGSDYDDQPWSHYHFPNIYRALVERSLGEWFVYYEPRRSSGREAYVALGRLGKMWPDPVRREHFYVQILDYEMFANPVPWRSDVSGRTLEKRLLKADGSTNKGQFGRSVRSLSLVEFSAIVELGFAGARDDTPQLAKDEEGAARLMVQSVVHRTVRDRTFTKNVQAAYSKTCAFTGLRIVSSGGWSEMEAAHIQPLQADGPDSVRNGIGLSRTIRALFDRGFLSLSDDFEILESQAVPLPEPVRSLLAKDRLARVPVDPVLRPHRSFLEFHRKNIFKGRAA